MIEKTQSAEAPWTLVSGMDSRAAAVQVFRTVIDAVQARLEERRSGESENVSLPLPASAKPLSLSEVDLTQSLTREEYKNCLKEEKARLAKNQNLLYLKRIPLVVGFEGWDAAGKGGCIKRLSSPLDARGYAALPIASPTPEEKKRHFLWRFYARLPKSGHIAIFDRTWYGRVLVERIEGFCSEADWKRAYGEINDFESYLVSSGTLVVKFWIHISKDEQLKALPRQRAHARKAVENHRRGLAKPREVGALRDRGQRYAPLHLDRDSALAHTRRKRQVLRSDSGAPHCERGD